MCSEDTLTCRFEEEPREYVDKPLTTVNVNGHDLKVSIDTSAVRLFDGRPTLSLAKELGLPLEDASHRKLKLSRALSS